MLWNRPPNMTPRQHFQKDDPRNLGAANRRTAELRRDERLVTPPEELPSWEWFNPRRMASRRATEWLAGDPEHARSALGGWVQRGVMWDSHHGAQESTARMKPSKPQPLSDRVMSPGDVETPPMSAAAAAVATLHGCKFPIGEVFLDDFYFCNEERLGVGPYCARHAKLCFCSGRCL